MAGVGSWRVEDEDLEVVREGGALVDGVDDAEPAGEAARAAGSGGVVPDRVGSFHGATTSSTPHRPSGSSLSPPPPTSPSPSSPIPPELGNASPVPALLHPSTPPNQKCWTTGTFWRTSTLYILSRPDSTFAQLGTVVAMLCRSGECSWKGPVLSWWRWRIDERKRYDTPSGEIEDGRRIDDGRRVGWAAG